VPGCTRGLAEPRVVVSGAAGAVGSIVCQLGKINGLRVVGIAGGKDKCDYLRSIKVDAVIDYKDAKETVAQALDRVCPDGVDVRAAQQRSRPVRRVRRCAGADARAQVYFDNTGGEISDAVMVRIRKFARIAICGQISQCEHHGRARARTGGAGTMSHSHLR
jgi:NADPH-dependent curcumin reductase CurA